MRTLRVFGCLIVLCWLVGTGCSSNNDSSGGSDTTVSISPTPAVKKKPMDLERGLSAPRSGVRPGHGNSPVTGAGGQPGSRLKTDVSSTVTEADVGISFFPGAKMVGGIKNFTTLPDGQVVGYANAMLETSQPLSQVDAYYGRLLPDHKRTESVTLGMPAVVYSSKGDGVLVAIQQKGSRTRVLLVRTRARSFSKTGSVPSGSP